MPRTKTKRRTAKKKEEKVPLKIAEIVKMPILASLGALALAQEGMEKVLHLVVEKGKMTEEEGSRLLEEFKQKGQRGREDLQAKIEEGILRVLERYNIPSREDMNEIKRKVDLLAKKIEDIKAQRKEG